MKQNKKPKDSKTFIKMKKKTYKMVGIGVPYRMWGKKKQFKLNLNPYLPPEAQVTSI
jgi:hypothetical protein